MYISIDIGGTTTRVASSKTFNEIHKVEKFPTQKNIELDRTAIRDSIMRVSDNFAIKAICLGIPGKIDSAENKIINVPNYSSLNNNDSRVLIDPIYNDVEVFVLNDALLAGLAEATLGSGKNFNSVAYITLSTGVGGVLVENKVVSPFHVTYEPGHSIIDKESPNFDSAKIKGSAEVFLSGKFFEQTYGESPETCVNHDIWRSYGVNLAKFLISIVSFWNPEAVVLGGGLSKNIDLFLGPALTEFATQNFFVAPKIFKAHFMDDAGLMGGILYLKSQLTQ